MEHEEIKAPRGAIWLAEAFAFYLDKAEQAVHFIADQFTETKPLDQCETAQDVIDYANSIKHRDPSFANDLIAAANRSDSGL